MDEENKEDILENNDNKLKKEPLYSRGDTILIKSKIYKEWQKGRINSLVNDKYIIEYNDDNSIIEKDILEEDIQLIEKNTSKDINNNKFKVGDYVLVDYIGCMRYGIISLVRLNNRYNIKCITPLNHLNEYIIMIDEKNIICLSTKEEVEEEQNEIYKYKVGEKILAFRVDDDNWVPAVIKDAFKGYYEIEYKDDHYVKGESEVTEENIKPMIKKVTYENNNEFGIEENLDLNQKIRVWNEEKKIFEERTLGEQKELEYKRAIKREKEMQEAMAIEEREAIENLKKNVAMSRQAYQYSNENNANKLVQISGVTPPLDDETSSSSSSAALPAIALHLDAILHSCTPSYIAVSSSSTAHCRLLIIN